MKQLRRRENGQGLVEYALILVLVAVIVIAILTLLGPQVGNVFSRVVDGLGGADASGGGGGNTQPTGNVTSVNALRGGSDVVVQIQVSAPVMVTAVDSQSGQTASTNCNGSCTVTLSNVGPNPGTVTVSAAGGNSMTGSYPAQN